MERPDLNYLERYIARPPKAGPLLFTVSLKVDTHPIKKNGKAIRNKGRGRADFAGWHQPKFIGSSDKYILEERILVQQLWRRAVEIRHREPISDFLWCMFLFIYPQEEFYLNKTYKKKDGTIRLAGSVSENLPDLSNLYECPQDAMQSAGIITDDNLIKSHDGSRILPGPEKELHIFLFKYLGDEVQPRST